MNILVVTSQDKWNTAVAIEGHLDLPSFSNMVMAKEIQKAKKEWAKGEGTIWPV